jgi:hypothetical protein
MAIAIGDWFFLSIAVNQGSFVGDGRLRLVPFLIGTNRQSLSTKPHSELSVSL